MPFKSQAQRNLMYAIENDPAVSQSTGIPQTVAKKFTAHDPGGKLPKHVKKKGKKRGPPKVAPKNPFPGVGILGKARL